MMSPVPNPDWTVYGASLAGVLQAAARLGADRDALMRAVAIEPAALRDPEQRFPVTALYALYELAARHTATPDLGLYTGRIAHINGLNLQLYMSTICETFRDYLNLMPSVLRFAGDIGEVLIRSEGSFIRLEWRPLWAETSRSRFLSDELLTTSAAIVNSLCIRPIPVRRAYFSYPEPDDLTLLKTTFGEVLCFEQAVSCLYFDRDSLDFPLTQLSGDLNTAMARPVDHLFSPSCPRDLFLDQLRQSILRLLPEGEMSVDKVAALLNLSRRTLQRRLSDRDTQFQQVLQQVRADLALRYLADERLGVTDIAFLLGYSDPATFSKAFKAWHGLSPREHRQR